MLKKRMDGVLALSTKIPICRYISMFLGTILCGFLFIPIAASEVPEISTTKLGTVDGLVQGIQSKRDFTIRRDPFAPIKKRRAISAPKKLHLNPLPIPAIATIEDPKLKLLGVISGQFERQAVIQVSSGERIFAGPGLELVNSGWIIKTISEGEVLMEHLSTSSSGKGLPQSKTFILSFPTPGKFR